MKDLTIEEIEIHLKIFDLAKYLYPKVEVWNEIYKRYNNEAKLRVYYGA